MATIRRRGDKWQVRYYDPEGKRKARSWARKSDALAFVHAVETDKRRDAYIDPQLTRTRFEDWARQHLASKHDVRASTRATDDSYFRNHLLPAFGALPLGRIGTLDVQGWVNDLRGAELAPKTIRECYRLMSGIMRAAVHAGLMGASPCRGIRLPRVERVEQRFLTAEEVERLAGEIHVHHRALVYSAVYLGCRWGELAGLRRRDLDLLRHRVNVVGTLEEIGGRVRWTPETKSSASRRALSVPGFLTEVLAAHLAGAPESDYVFTTTRGAPLRRSSFRGSYWLPAVDRAGLAPLRFHDLRHTCAALLIEQGAHPKEIQARLGHASITTTLNTYGHLMPSLDERLGERLDAAYRSAKAGANGDQMGTRLGAEVIELSGASEQQPS